jgi:23S rRNA C2498 (ribose-2'-O)-methylase RlmM
MQIELKKVNINERMSEETTAFTADLYINGKKVGYAKNDGHGGSTFYQSYGSPADRKAIQDAEDYCKSLPSMKFPARDGMKAWELEMNLEHYIDDLLEKEIRKKNNKAMEKKMVNSLLWGVPGGYQYKQVKYKVALSQIPKEQLQAQVDRYKRTFKPGEQFFNTNFEELGITV